MKQLPVEEIFGEDYYIEHQALFQTPLFRASLSGDIDNDKLAEEIYKLREENPESINHSNEGGWHSPGYIGEKMNPIFKPVIEGITKVVKDLPFTPKIDKISELAVWTIINKKGDWNQPHQHPDCDMSGVYYVKVPKGDCGNIKFWDPRESLQYGNRFVLERYNGGESTERYPVEGDLWLFPSAFKHSVLPSKVDGDRICVSFNLSF